jgi:integrase
LENYTFLSKNIFHFVSYTSLFNLNFTLTVHKNAVFIRTVTRQTQKSYGINKNKYLLDPEFDHLNLLLKRYILKDTRNCLLIYLALHTGARATELLSLQKEDLNVYDQSVFIHGIKGSNDREIPLPDWLFDTLENYSKNQDQDLLFDITYHRLRQIWQIYRPAKKKFHSLRHTFAIRLYKKVKDIRLLQIALGHRNITNTMIYADFVYSQSEMRKLIL